VQGRQIAVLGEAVVGARVAGRLDLGPGDTVVSSPENLFDLDGVYPLQLQIVGVLTPTGTPDDEAVFVDIKTTWVIAGIEDGALSAIGSFQREAEPAPQLSAKPVAWIGTVTGANLAAMPHLKICPDRQVSLSDRSHGHRYQKP
jgi:hypothetical protein